MRALKVIEADLDRVRFELRINREAVVKATLKVLDLEEQEQSLLEAKTSLEKVKSPSPRIVNNGTSAPRIEWDLVPGVFYKTKWNGKYLNHLAGVTSWTIIPVFPGESKTIGWSWNMTPTDDHWIVPELTVVGPKNT